jgi:hypothetical protein
MLLIIFIAPLLVHEKAVNHLLRTADCFSGTVVSPICKDGYDVHIGRRLWTMTNPDILEQAAMQKAT